MNQTPEFFEGSIARDHREVLDSVPVLNAATKKAGTTGKSCSNPHVCPKAGTTGKGCSNPDVCPKPGTTGKGCSRPKVCPKASATDAFPPTVSGWSMPPAPPSA